MLLDTPGVIPYPEGEAKRTEGDLAMIGSKNVQKLQDPEQIAMEIILGFEGQVEEFYGVTRDAGEDEEDVLAKIALKRQRLLKGGKPDTLTMAKILIKDWQEGRIKK